MTSAMRVLMVLLLAAFGCGDDGGGNGGGADAASIDAPTVNNALGLLCTPGTVECPANHTCVILNTGSDTDGYCSPNCGADDSVCTTGYTGPASSTPVCFNPTVAGTCTIGCSVEADCPPDLDCLSASPMAPSFCAAPE